MTSYPTVFRSVALATCISLGLVAPAHGQGTLAEFKRAEMLMSWNAPRLVSNITVRPFWIGNTDRFWYRRLVTGGKEFMLVDPARGSRAPAFDHARLALALSQVTDTNMTALALPFDSLEFRGSSAIEVNTRKGTFTCDIGAYSCAKAPAPAAPNRNEVLSPDGKWAAFKRNHNLWIRSTATDEEVRLTDDGAENYDYASSPGSSTSYVSVLVRGLPDPPTVQWSPDSRRFLTHRLDQRRVRQLHLLQSVPKEGFAAVPYSYRYSLPGDSVLASAQLLVVDVAARSVVTVSAPPVEVPFNTPIVRRHTWWSEDGSSVHFVRPGRAARSLELNTVDAATGVTRVLFKEEGKTYVEPHLTLGELPNARVLGGGAEFIWFSERDGWAHLYLYDGRTGRLKNQVTRGSWLVRDVIRVDEKARRVIFTAAGREGGDPYFRKLYSINLDGSDLKLLTPEDADHEFVFSPSGSYLVDNFSRVDTVPRSVVRRIDGRPAVDLETADLSRLFATGWRFPERFVAKAADGVTDLYGVIYRPIGFDLKRKYPVLDDIYPGPQIIRTAKTFSLRSLLPDAESQLGFIVVQVDGRGTPFRSKEFHDYSYGKLEQAGSLDDHIAVLEQLAKRYPQMDLERVGIYGHSGGGYAATRAVLAYPDFYKVAVSSAGNQDQRGYLAIWGETYQGLPTGDLYAAQSNVALASRLKGKLLLVTGDMDDNVPPALTLQLVDAFIKADKDVDLLILPNRNHGFGNEPYFIRRRWNYFVKHLLGVEPPAGYSLRGPG